MLNYFRRGSLEPGYALHELEPDRSYKIVVTGHGGALPRDLDGTVYDSRSEAVHAVFLRRVDALMRATPEGKGTEPWRRSIWQATATASAPGRASGSTSW